MAYRDDVEKIDDILLHVLKSDMK